MGEVYAATDLILQREVAVKRLHSVATEGGPETARFYREAQALARINDPSVVSVFDVQVQDGHPCIVMELVDAPTLRAVLETEGALTPSRAVAIAGSVASALAAVHAKGIVHRDVKPSNIFVTPSGQVKLADFGIARLASAATLTAVGEVLGSPTYLAPERVAAGEADHRSDLYSLGCVLFEMLVGRPPFEATDAMAITYQHVHAAPPRVDQLDPSIAAALATLVARLLAKDPADRPQSAHELIRELRSIDLRPSEGGSTAVLAGRAARSAPGRSMRWVPWVVVGGLVLASLIGVALFAGTDPGATPQAGPSPTVGGLVATSTQSSSSPSPSETASPPAPSPEDAAVALLALVEQAADDELISDDLAEEIEEKVDEAFEELEEGDGEKALDELAKLSEDIQEAVEHEEISQEAATELVVAVQALQAAILAS